MVSSIQKILLLLAALLGCITEVRAQARPSAMDTETSIELQVIYVPTKDLHRAPGYSDEGVYLPLSHIHALVVQANARETSSPGKAGPWITQVQLKGTIEGNSIRFRGQVRYESRSPEWHAVRLDSGSFPWSAQSASDRAFIARVGKQVDLFCRGEGAGEFHVEALLPISPGSSRARFNLGRFYSPAELQITVPNGWSLRTSHDPASLESVEQSGVAGEVLLFPASDQALTLEVLRDVELDASTLRQALQTRSIRLDAGVFEVSDELTFTDGSGSTSTIDIQLPAGSELIGASSGAMMDRLTTGVRVTPRPNETTTTVSMKSAVRPAGSETLIDNLRFDAVIRAGELALHAGEQFVPVLLESTPQYELAGVSKTSTRYVVPGDVGSIKLGIASVATRLPLQALAITSITAGEALTTYTIALTDNAPPALELNVPTGWLVHDATLRGADHTVLPLSMVNTGEGLHRLAWPGPKGPVELTLLLHSAGAWGDPGTTSSLQLPVMRIEAADQELQMVNIWPANLDVRPLDLVQLLQVPDEETSYPGHLQQGERRYNLQSTGAHPSGLLVIAGREAEMSATVVTDVSITEDQALARAMIRYDSRLAPAGTFRFTLPRGTGSGVKIAGSAIRESFMQPGTTGDEWTVVTQQRAMGTVTFTAEWPLDYTRGKPLDVPAVKPLGVSSQSGYIVLEGAQNVEFQFTSRNLEEADPVDIPGVPWKRENRIIAGWSYLHPEYTLRIDPQLIASEPGLQGLVREANLTSIVAPDGNLLTQAIYTITNPGTAQFFEVTLPPAAQLWSVLLSGSGARPVLPAEKQTSGTVLVALPAASQGRETTVSLLYRDSAPRLEDVREIKITAPKLSAPVNRTTWDLNLPRDFEYLQFGSSLSHAETEREPVARFLRTAYYPKALIFKDARPMAILIVTVIGMLFAAPMIRRRYHAKPRETEKRPGKPGRSPVRSLVEVLIVVAIIAILAAISVPNFLEAQIRSKVSRVKNDARSMATAIETYYVDNNRFPVDADILHQGSVKYMTSQFSDPYADYKGSPLRYLSGKASFDKAVNAGLVSPQQVSDDFWMVYSVGPDAKDDGGELVYDPTNGTVSAGDVIRIRDVGQVAHEPRYRDAKQAEEQKASTSQAASAVRFRKDTATALPTLAETEESDKAQQVPGQAAPPPPAAPAPPPSAAPAPPPSAAPAKPPVISGIPDLQVGDMEDNIGQNNNYFVFTNAFNFGGSLNEQQVAQAARQASHAGLLSLAVELPRGGIQRHFEGLGAEAQINVELLPARNFGYLRFLVWMGVFVLLVIVYLRARRLYPALFVAAIAVSLLVPVFVQTPWAGLYNAIVQGAIISLAAPLVSRLMRKVQTHSKAQAAAILMLVAVTPARGSDDAGAIQVVVPYEYTSAPLSVHDPLAFISKGEFARLWNDSTITTGTAKHDHLIVSSVSINAELDMANSRITGTLTLHAINTSDSPLTAPLQLQSFSLTDTRSVPAGGVLQSTTAGLRLLMPPHSTARITSSFIAPCMASGRSGSVQFTMPRAAAGTWRLLLASPAVELASNTSSPHFAEVTDRGIAAAGPIVPGKFHLAWTLKDKPAAVTSTADASFEADITHTVQFTGLTWADWNSLVKLRAAANSSLPSQIQLRLPPGHRVVEVSGKELQRAQVAGETVTLDLQPAQSAELRLNGLLLKNEDAKSSTTGNWSIAPPQLTSSTRGSRKLNVYVANDLEILSATPRDMQRIRSASTAPGYSVQTYDASSTNAQLALDVKRAEPKFDARVVDVFVLRNGKSRRVTSVSVKPQASILRQCVLQMSQDSSMESVQGPGIASWVQHGSHVWVNLADETDQEFSFETVARIDGGSTSTELVLQPPQVQGALNSDITQAIAVLTDADLQEISVGRAGAGTPSQLELDLAQKLIPKEELNQGTLRSYALQKHERIRVALRPVAPRALVRTLNKLTISESAQRLHCLVKIEPQRGRVRNAELILVAPAADESLVRRIQPGSNVSEILGTVTAPGRMQLMVELAQPVTGPTEVSLNLELPANIAGTSVSVPVILPVQQAGSEAFMLVHRELEGELKPLPGAGIETIEPRQVPWPADQVVAAPADFCARFAGIPASPPGFSVTRHERSQTLRAIVEMLRQRSVVSTDGTVRNEVEMVVQNHSEQYLKLQLPYPRKDIRVYEVQVAGRNVGVSFGSDGGRDVLLIPLLRTGLLEPELTVRVVYVAQTGETLSGSGKLRQTLPGVGGGIPVAQSALILMLPLDFDYSSFGGTLNAVDLIDIEVGETLRRSRRLEQLSESALYSKGETKKAAYSKLASLKEELASELSSNKIQADASKRAADARQGNSRFAPVDRRLEGERYENLKLAEKSQQQLLSNVGQLGKTLSVESQSQMPSSQIPSNDMITTLPQSAETPIQFPRVGKLLVFRQLQGTGYVDFSYQSHEARQRIYDALFAFGAIVLVALMFRFRGLLLRPTRPMLAVIAVLLLILAGLNIILDVTLPALALTCLFLLFKPRVKDQRAVY